MSDKPCSNCGVIDLDVQYHLPPKPIALAYKELALSGQHYKAAMFLALNKDLFSAFCLKCWVEDYVIGAMLDETTTDDYKITVINKHITETMSDVGSEMFWSKVGSPGLN